MSSPTKAICEGQLSDALGFLVCTSSVKREFGESKGPQGDGSANEASGVSSTPTVPLWRCPSPYAPNPLSQ